MSVVGIMDPADKEIRLKMNGELDSASIVLLSILGITAVFIVIFIVLFLWEIFDFFRK